MAATEGWPRAGNERLPRSSDVPDSVAAGAAPSTPLRSPGAAPHTPGARASPPRGRSCVGGGWGWGGDGCSSTILGLGRPHPHPSDTGPSGAQGEAGAPCAPCPRGRRGESLLLRTSGLCLGSPASRRRGEANSGRREGAGREPAPESQSAASRAGWGLSPETDPLTASGNGSLPCAQSSKTSTLHRLFPAGRNRRQSPPGKLRPEVWAPEGSRVHLAYQFRSCASRDLPSGPRVLPARTAPACSPQPAEGASRCERDTGVRDPGVLGTQVARRTQLNGPKRVANTAPALHPLQRDLGP